jgi:hypothetical protein
MAATDSHNTVDLASTDIYTQGQLASAHTTHSFHSNYFSTCITETILNTRQHAAIYLFLGLSTVVSAQSLADEERWAKQTNGTERHIADVKNHCGADVALTYDKPSWDKVQAEWGKGSPFGRCKDAYDALVNMCVASNGAAAKKAIVAKVKTVSCSYGGFNSGYKMSFSNGTIFYAVEVDKNNVVEKLMADIRAKL